MSPRLKLRAAATPLVVAGALWASIALAPIAFGGGAQTPPPCGPDGVCVPRPQTYGWYQTRWHTFPGDVAKQTPTPATDADKPVEEDLGGPKEPGPSQEGLLGPAKAPRAVGAPAQAPAGEEDPAAAGLGTLPGEVPLPGMELPGFGQPAAPAPDAGAPAAPDAAPGAVPEPGAVEPGRDPLDPFGAAPPAPPAWLKNASRQRSVPSQVTPLAALPAVEQATMTESATPRYATVESALVNAAPVAKPAATIALDGPNLHGDDAPPQLPPALQGGIGQVAPARRVAPPQAAATQHKKPARSMASSLVQPASVAISEDDRVTPASANQPLGIQLVNPAAALAEPEGLQQAIYLEATDQ